MLLPSHSDRSDEDQKSLLRLPVSCDRGHSAVLRSAVRADAVAAALLKNRSLKAAELANYVASAFTQRSLGRKSKIGLGNTVRRAPIDAVAQGASA